MTVLIIKMIPGNALGFNVCQSLFDYAGTYLIFIKYQAEVKLVRSSQCHD